MTETQLSTYLDGQLPTNNNKQITAARLRNVLMSIVPISSSETIAITNALSSNNVWQHDSGSVSITGDSFVVKSYSTTLLDLFTNDYNIIYANAVIDNLSLQAYTQKITRCANYVFIEFNGSLPTSKTTLHIRVTAYYVIGEIDEDEE